MADENTIETPEVVGEVAGDAGEAQGRRGRGRGGNREGGGGDRGRGRGGRDDRRGPRPGAKKGGPKVDIVRSRRPAGQLGNTEDTDDGLEEETTTTATPAT